MAEATTRLRWRPTLTHLIAGALVLAGFLLAGASWWFFLLAGLGTFGPGVLREMGWLRDRDEFQRQSDQRAGYHAFLVAGLVGFALVAYFRSGDRQLEHPQELATLFLAVLWFSWFLSTLLSYWGPRKTAARVLYAFGTVWCLFAVIANTGSEWTGWLALLLHPLLSAPFFLLGWLSRRWRRTSGLLLLVVSVFFVRFFGFFRDGTRDLANDGVVFVLLVGPLLACGVALLAAGGEEDEG